jgi:uncharacterized protein (TIGR03435 family)
MKTQVNDFRIKPVFTIVKNLITTFLLAAGAFAQAPAFEAATIKPTKQPFGSTHWDSHPGMIMLGGQTLKGLICIAYHVKDNQVAGGPKWIDAERYDINAKAEGPAGDPQLLNMLQTLLADRFQLTFHHEEKIASTYALVVAKSGLKIKPVEGATGSRSSGGKGKIAAQGVTMAKLADQLSRRVGGPVTDLTGVSGAYDFTLEWSTEGDPDDVQSALFAALQEQLGVKLEMRKLPLDLLVVDRAEKPSEN